MTGTSDVLDVYDHEVLQITQLMMTLNDRARYRRHNYLDFGREITDKFAAIGFTVDISWYGFSAGGQEQDGAMPEVTITGRTEAREFDKDRQVHEVTRNILEIPGEDGVLKTDPDTLRNFLEGNGGHGHGHSH